VESNSTIIKASTEPENFRTIITLQEAQENIEFLRTQVESWVAVLFNVYGSVARDSRTMVGDVINSWLSIASEKVDSFDWTLNEDVTYLTGEP
jgi:ribosomal RNA-processing protein 12